MKRALVFTTQAEAEALQAKLDAAAGYPRAHPPTARGTVFRTLHLVAVVKHATLNQWAICVDDTTVQAAVTVQKQAASARIAANAALQYDPQLIAKTDQAVTQKDWDVKPKAQAAPQGGGK